jgi:hypothetical protein
VPPKPQPTSKPNRTTQTLKLLFIGFILLPLNSFWVVDTAIAGHGVNFTRVSLFMNAIFVIFVLSLINPLLKRYTPKFTFSHADLVLIYVMLCVSSAIAGHDMIQRLFPLIGHAFHFASPENDWQELFHGYVPRWLVVTDRLALAGYYKDRGEFFYNTLYVSEHLRVWLVPCLAWSSVIIALLVCMLCINLLVRKQWSERERLTYPLAQIPLEIINNGPRLFKTQLIWIGFAASLGLNLLNGIHYLFPIFPSFFYGRFMLSQYFTTRPWNYMGWMPIEFHPFAVGLAFFMPLDLSFSCWFFYWFWRFERVFGVTVFGGGALAGFPFTWAQSIGTCAAILVMTLWGLRVDGWKILKSFFKTPPPDEQAEMRVYRRAVFGILLSMGYLVGFCYVAGMAVWVSTLFFLIFFGLSTVVTRIRVEAGYPMHDFAFRPEDIVVTTFGTRPIGPHGLTLFSYLHFFTYAHRSNPQPHELEAFRLADRMNLSINRLLIVGILIATVVGSIGACWAYLHTAYHYRGGTWPGWPIFNRLQNWLNYSRDTDFRSLIFMGVGFGIGMGFLIARRLFIWWPFHPAGYVIGGTWSLNLLWFSIFVSWVAKFIILRVGGLKLHRQASAFFIGLVLGEFVMASFWGVIGAVLGQPTYRFI